MHRTLLRSRDMWRDHATPRPRSRACDTDARGRRPPDASFGDSAFLRPYEEGRRDESLRLARVRALIGNEQPFADDLDRIAAAAREWRGRHAEPLIAAVRRDGPASESSAPIRRSNTEFATLRRLYRTQQAHLDAARDRARADVPCRITVGCVREGEDWHLCVSDNGIGIAPEFTQKVFVIFQRLHGRDEYEGTGIGLAICRKIVEFHGGRIRLDEETPEGTRIRFTLPVAAAPASSAAEPLVADTAAGRPGHG
ncbi:ATP-binding protein [Streptomyces sp. NPDC102437]|uniref:ATP-binding protein n=1 Tax=Streptomyces sp. NPDC102437 TaxID=3366175 RepID=UPI0037F6A662